MIFGLSGVRLYAALGAALLVAAFLAWVVRIDTLRSHYKRDLATSEANFAQFRADVTANTELARISDAANKARVEASQEQTRSESDADIRRRIADAVARVRAQAGPGQGRGAGPAVPQTTNPAGSPSGAGEAPAVSADDLTICAENTIKAIGWQDWWKQVSTIDREGM